MQHVLEMKGIYKSFAGVEALSDADLTLDKGETRALLGINGAGKSTMIKILSGVYDKDAGEILIDGKLCDITSPKSALTHGVSAVYQDPQMVESFTGYENIYLGNEGTTLRLLSGINRRKLKKNAIDLVAQYPFEIDVDKRIHAMSAVEREIIAILRALSRNCRILILDEPTSILTDKEKHALFEFIRELKAQGVSIIYITHHLDEVSQICDSFSVFRNGKVVCHEKITDQKVDSSYIAELMLGEKLEQLYPEKTHESPPAACLRAELISMNGKFTDISFEAKKGEIFGIFGLVGSGIDEISKTLYGAMSENAGSIYKDGRKLKLVSPGHAIREGIFLVPGNRKTEGFLNGMSVSFNITISKLEKTMQRFFVVDRRRETRNAQEMVSKLSISTPNVQKKVNELSGGNQQKVVIAKGLYADADVYIFAEPTVGVDLGAKSAIYDTMRALAQHAAVIIISSEPEEVMGNSDRVMVIYKGKATLHKDAGDTTLKEMLIHAISSEEAAKP